jgi:hypothetical protein
MERCGGRERHHRRPVIVLVGTAYAASPSILAASSRAENVTNQAARARVCHIPCKAEGSGADAGRLSDSGARAGASSLPAGFVAAMMSYATSFGSEPSTDSMSPLGVTVFVSFVGRPLCLRFSRPTSAAKTMPVDMASGANCFSSLLKNSYANVMKVEKESKSGCSRVFLAGVAVGGESILRCKVPKIVF